MAKTKYDKRQFCPDCKNPLTIELKIEPTRLGSYSGPMSDGGYGRFSVIRYCPWCRVRDRETVKFGNKFFLDVTKIALECWDVLGCIPDIQTGRRMARVYCSQELKTDD